MSAARRRRGWRALGWLLTPFVVWAASFFGGWLGALLGDSVLWLGVGAVAGGVGGVVGWSLIGRARRSALGPRPDAEHPVPSAESQQDDAADRPSSEA